MCSHGLLECVRAPRILSPRTPRLGLRCIAEIKESTLSTKNGDFVMVSGLWVALCALPPSFFRVALVR